MNKKNNPIYRVFVYLAALALWFVAGAVPAQSAQGQDQGQKDSQRQRPVYVDIRPVGSEQHSSLSDGLIEAMARDNEQLRRFIGDDPIRKVIVVPGKLVNFVV